MKQGAIFKMSLKLPENLPLRLLSSKEQLYRVYTQSNTSNTALNSYHYLDINKENKLILKETGEDAFESDATHRFTPIINNNKLVPSLYLANSPQAALSETIFRKSDVIEGYSPKPITLRHVKGKHMTLISLANNLRLCNLTTPLLAGGLTPKFNFSADDTISGPASAKCYRRCHDIATAIFNHTDNVDGLYWESRHLPNTFNILIWDRGHPIIQSAIYDYPLSTGHGLREIIEESARLNIPCSSLII